VRTRDLPNDCRQRSMHDAVVLPTGLDTRRSNLHAAPLTCQHRSDNRLARLLPSFEASMHNAVTGQRQIQLADQLVKAALSDSAQAAEALLLELECDAT